MMPRKPETITRALLARYAGLLGRGSIAAQALDVYDGIRATGNSATIVMHNSGFYVSRKGVQEFPRMTLRP